MERENNKMREQGYRLLERRERWRGLFSQRERTAGTRADTELQPLGQGEPCNEPVEIKILQPHCYQSRAHHPMHILFEEQTLSFPSSSGERAPQCILCQETYLFLRQTRSTFSSPLLCFPPYASLFLT